MSHNVRAAAGDETVKVIFALPISRNKFLFYLLTLPIVACSFEETAKEFHI